MKIIAKKKKIGIKSERAQNLTEFFATIHEQSNILTAHIIRKGVRKAIKEKFFQYSQHKMFG